MHVTTDDIVAIQNLAASFYRALDSKDADAYGAFLTDDAVMVHPFGQTAGKEAILEWVRQHIAQGNEDAARHCITNPLVEPHPDGALFSCYVIRMRVDVAPPMIGSGGLEIICVKTADGWRVKHKTISVDVMPTAA